MKANVYTLRDSVIATHSLPFYAQNEDHAKRICRELIASGDTVPAQNPGDFELFQIATFDDETGRLLPCEELQAICRLDSLSTTSSSPMV